MISVKIIALAGCLSLISAHSTSHSTTLSTTLSTTHSTSHTTVSSTSLSSSHSTTISTSHLVTSSATSSTAQASTTKSTTTSTVTPVPNVGQYGQCGGQSFVGGTICPVDWICVVANAFFSQCLPGPNYTAPPQPTPSSTTTSYYPVQTWDYVFTFGDSWTKTGFDLAGTKPSTGNQLGNPAFPGLTTSGGPNWVGDLAKFNSQLLIYNFASAGATIDASLVASKVAGALSFIDQVTEFTSNLVPPPAYAPWVSNSTLFAIWMGNTDVILAWNESDWSTLSQQLIDSYFKQVELLYAAGARNFVFAEVPPIDRTPAILQQSAAKQQAMAAAIALFNSLLNTETDSLVDTKMNGQYYSPSPVGFAQVVDTQDGFDVLLDNPTEHGAPNASCYNPDGVSCMWVDEWNPGQQLQSIVETYITFIGALYSS